MAYDPLRGWTPNLDYAPKVGPYLPQPGMYTPQSGPMYPMPQMGPPQMLPMPQAYGTPTGGGPMEGPPSYAPYADINAQDEEALAQATRAMYGQSQETGVERGQINDTQAGIMGLASLLAGQMKHKDNSAHLESALQQKQQSLDQEYQDKVLKAKEKHASQNARLQGEYQIAKRKADASGAELDQQQKYAQQQAQWDAQQRRAEAVQRIKAQQADNAARMLQSGKSWPQVVAYMDSTAGPGNWGEAELKQNAAAIISITGHNPLAPDASRALAEKNLAAGRNLDAKTKSTLDKLEPEIAKIEAETGTILDRGAMYAATVPLLRAKTRLTDAMPELLRGKLGNEIARTGIYGYMAETSRQNGDSANAARFDNLTLAAEKAQAVIHRGRIDAIEKQLTGSTKDKSLKLPPEEVTKLRDEQRLHKRELDSIEQRIGITEGNRGTAFEGASGKLTDPYAPFVPDNVVPPGFKGKIGPGPTPLPRTAADLLMTL